MMVFAERIWNMVGFLDVIVFGFLQLACARDNSENKLLHDL